jgi:hypothetical protein
MENPNSLDSIIKVVNKLGEIAQVEGFIEQSKMIRKWFFVSADLGAIRALFKYIDTDRNGIYCTEHKIFGKIRYIISDGHEMMSLLKMILKLCKDHRYSYLAASYGFKTPADIAVLFNNIDTHIFFNV